MYNCAQHIGALPRGQNAAMTVLTADPLAERFWRDLRVHSILEGTNQVMRMIVGRELTRQ